jgi:hypothetical protein
VLGGPAREGLERLGSRRIPFRLSMLRPRVLALVRLREVESYPGGRLGMQVGFRRVVAAGDLGPNRDRPGDDLLPNLDLLDLQGECYLDVRPRSRVPSFRCEVGVDGPGRNLGLLGLPSLGVHNLGRQVRSSRGGNCLGDLRLGVLHPSLGLQGHVRRYRVRANRVVLAYLVLHVELERSR